jgi:hypothetical protein
VGEGRRPREAARKRKREKRRVHANGRNGENGPQRSPAFQGQTSWDIYSILADREKLTSDKSSPSNERAPAGDKTRGAGTNREGKSEGRTMRTNGSLCIRSERVRNGDGREYAKHDDVNKSE